MTKALFKDTVRAIGKHFSRYISMLLIIALGTCFFVGIKATSPDMYATSEEYFKDCNLMDIRLQSSIGFTDDDIKAIAAVDGIDYVMGQKFADALILVNGEIEADIDGTQISTRAYGFNPVILSAALKGANDGNYINRFQLLKGRFPTAANECLVDESQLSTPESFTIGNTITLTGERSSAVSGLGITEFIIVGIIRTPYYISYERGNTNIGSGKIGTFIYVPDDAFSSDYYSEIYATVAGASQIDSFTYEYKNLVSPVVENIKRISDARISTRLSTLKPELEKKIVDAQAQIDNSSDEAKNALVEIDSKIEQLQNLVTNGQTLIAQAQAEFDTKFANATTEYNNNYDSYNAAIKEYSLKRIEYEAKNDEYLQKSSELTAAQKAYDTVYSEWQNATAQIASAKQTITTTQSLISAGETVLQQLQDTQTSSASNEQLQSIITMMQTTYPDLYNSVKALTTAGLATEIASGLAPYIDDQKTILAKQQALLEEKNAQLASLETALTEYNTALEKAASELTAAKSQLGKAETDLNEFYTQLVNGGYQLQTGELELQIAKMSAESELNALKENVTSAPTNLAIAKEKREEIVSTLDGELFAAENDLQDAKNLYAKLSSVKWNFYTRDDSPGYKSFGQSVENISVLSDIFPVFFFLLASLVCLITMTRFIEEDRTLVGTYKALGYSSLSIILKYVIYALSACVFGSAVGIASGIYIFPYAIDSAYSIIYTLPALKYSVPVDTCILGFAFSLICTCAATAFALMKELTLNPSKLMRPKTPKAGKRVALEKISSLWNRMNFSAKVTTRNLARNKGRSVMTILGVAGCTAMLLASLGMYDSIQAITENQYKNDPISKYDFQVLFSEEQSASSFEFNKVSSDARVEDAMLFSMKSVTGLSNNSANSIDVYLFIPHSNESLNNFVDLRSRTENSKYHLINNGVIITEKLAETLKLNIGDQIILNDSENRQYSFTVTAISENYVFNYVYCPALLYKQVTGSEPSFTYAIGKVGVTYKTSNGTVQSTTKSLMTTDFTRTSGITGISFTEETTDSISKVAETLSFVILIFFIASLILAFVVLYNISNISIIERNRELATLKVLGFVDNEVRSYIYRETVINSVVGIILGIGMGIGLHKLLIRYTAIDTVMYGMKIEPVSYAMSVAIAILIIVFVSIVLNRKVLKIDMVSSLKSVE